MKSKAKRQQNSPRILHFLERFLYWGAWIGLIATLFFAIREANRMREITLGSQPMFHTFYGLIWFPLITGVIGIVIGAIPTGLAFLISRLLRWALRLKEENASQAELIQQLLQQQHDSDIPAHLIDQDENDEMLPDLTYEQLSHRR